jgi:putative transposase
MKFDPQKHHRHSIRLQGYDYSQPGAYFITICTYHRECRFGEIIDGSMQLNICGKIIQACWDNLSCHFKFVVLDTFVIMPNHVHGIIVLNKEATFNQGEAFPQDFIHQPQSYCRNASPLQRPNGTKQRSLGAIIQNFKSISTRKINQINRSPGTPVWQRDYYEHIIRDEKALRACQQYIIENPLHWEDDEDNPLKIKSL